MYIFFTQADNSKKPKGATVSGVPTAVFGAYETTYVKADKNTTFAVLVGGCYSAAYQKHYSYA